MNRSATAAHPREPFWILALFVSAVALFSLRWFDGLPPAVSSMGAERVLAGELPYRDFWTMYAPGQFYLLAVLFGVFGSHFLVEIAASSLVCAAAACVCYRLIHELFGRRLEALACAVLFLASVHNTSYFRFLGSYPTAILLTFVAYTFLARHFRRGRLSDLAAAGLASGTAIVFKHDVGSYTALAIVAGIAAHHLLLTRGSSGRDRSFLLLRKLAAFAVGLGVIALPVYLFFAVRAGPDMLRDLVVFPLTDFRYSRPEAYTSIVPLGLYDPSPVKLLSNVVRYLKFGLPFALFLSGVVATVIAARRGRAEQVGWGMTLAVAYLLHYQAAHVQINTHLISLTFYGAALGVFFGDVAQRERPLRTATIRRVLGVILAVWLSVLVANPAYQAWWSHKQPSAELDLAKASGIRVRPGLAAALTNLSSFLATHVPPDEKLFVGLHRHDVVITGDVPLYFILDRPIATRYHELHPAITDTEPVQREIIAELRDNAVAWIIRTRIFDDSTLESVKKKHRENLPQIGATVLDEFIRANYVKVREFGRYEVWRALAPARLSG